MSIDHSVMPKTQSQPEFLKVVSGDVVVVWDHPELMDTETDAWWLGEVIYCEGGARNPKDPTLFQIADVDTGVIRWVNADCVRKVLLPVTQPITNVVQMSNYR